MNLLPRILILSPHILPRVTGNAVTAERWQQLLTKKGILVRLVSTQDLDPRGLMACIEEFSPHVVHGHHAFKSGRLFLAPLMVKPYANLPLVISLAGTDVASVGKEREIVLRVLESARVIIAQSGYMLSWLEKTVPHLMGKTLPVAKSVFSAGHAPYDLRKIFGWQATDIVFFLPAGIRPVKGNLECLPALNAAFRSRPQLRAVFAGPILDGAYGKRFKAEMARSKAFAR